MYLLWILATFFLFLFQVNAFIPANALRYVIDQVDKFAIDLGKVSKTLTHEDIVQRGVIRVIVKYLREQKTMGGQRVRKRHIEHEHMEKFTYDYLKSVYEDYYNKTVCEFDTKKMIFEDFEMMVAYIDIWDHTKDLPYAHFDAESFQESNQRVIEHTEDIYKQLKEKNYSKARQLTGQILHTIHDFYSHSNWVEMGNTDINRKIGTNEFDEIPAAIKETDNVTCSNSNCTLVTIDCNLAVHSLMLLLKKVAKFEKSHYTCPIRYFKCSGNIVALDRLVSGYYVNQKLPNNMTIEKPNRRMKCSHGGIVDSDSFKPALGGINKDSGYYFFSPHADLHLDSAKLAIKHTEYFLNEIRTKIGDKEFDKFLRILLETKLWVYHGLYLPGVCSAATPRVLYFNNFLLIFLVILVNLVHF